MEDDQLLLERILDGKEKPADLPLSLLRSITNDFSEERRIGHGGFGVVYKGILGKRIVAVKRIYVNLEKIDDDDKQFGREINSLWNTNHQNVVRFLGFCSNTHQKHIPKDGVMILANVRERLFCFEYISNGSLDNHITDELRGLEWKTRYEIITGICEGLRYLHEEKNIIHMDLKPANILVDHQDEKYMVPKITDFGLSRPNEISHTIGRCYGTLGYWSPENREGSKTTTACDIYSLGAIIMELVSGGMEVPDKNKVLRRWRHRWNKPPTQLQYHQVTRCMEIAGRCREQKPEARPSISNIISFLSESESTYGQISPRLNEDDMLRIKPLQLLVPCELKNEMSYSVELTNHTLNCIAFNIQVPSARYSSQPYKGIVRPEFKCSVKITVQAGDVQGRDHAGKFIVQSMQVEAIDGLSDQDITERMSHVDAINDVDEVDLMVIYEPAKPLENSKSREHTNMLAEEVPKKKRDIVEFASVKGKNKLGSSENAEETSRDISSSAQGQCTEQIDQCNLHSLQSFSRHSPTNQKYLGKKSPAVDHASGAMGSLLDKLGKLVTEDYGLETSIKRNIDSFSVQLKKIHLELPKLENVDGVEVLVDEVRELSYNIEDMVDSFLVHVEPDSNRSGFRELRKDGLKLWENGLMSHHHIADVIRDIKNQVQDVVDRKEQYNFNVNDVVDDAIAKATIERLRISAITIGIEQLIGIEVPRDDLISLIEEDGNLCKQNLKIVSIVGLGGLGKTTLANAVYDRLQEAPCHPKAFVPLGRNPVVEDVLKKLIFIFQKDFNTTSMEVWDLCLKLRELLKNKRYFIFIDDIGNISDWEVIRPAFPENKHGSRVITTTRDHDVALACCSAERKYVYEIKPLSGVNSRRLFFGRAFGPGKDCPDTVRKEEISIDILKKCGGMPLAIKSIASFLAGKPETTWEYVWKYLGALTDGNTLENMKQILDLSYIHLLDDLKTCMLYVCNYPEDREIDKDDLVRQWLAEGFVSATGGRDANDVAENYFRTLISMCMIQPVKIDYNDEVLSCKVHDIILDLMRSKSRKENFIHVIDGLKNVSGQIRRVSVQYNGKEDSKILETIKGSLSHARSIFLYRESLMPYFLVFKFVRLLHIEVKEDYSGVDLTGISSLFVLRYLKIACGRLCTGKFKLPDQIGQLQQLETIDIQGGIERTTFPSDIVTLPGLLHLRYTGYWGRILPDGIEMLKSLRTLEGVCVGEISIETMKGLGELTNLRTLGIKACFLGKSDEGMAVHMNALHSSISRLSTSLEILTLEGARTPSSWTRTPFLPGSHIRKLDLREWRNFQRCPEWIGQLHYLYSLSIKVREVADGINIVEGLPSLAYLEFSIDMCDEEREESVVISGRGTFQALKNLNFQCSNTSLTFEEGALPKLEKLEILFRHHPYCRFLPAVGIEYLPAPALQEIWLIVSTDDDWARKMEGHEDWDYLDWVNYFSSDQYRDKLQKQLRTLRHQLKKAFKEHHPSANIHIRIQDSVGEYEEEYCNDEADEGAYQVSEYLTSAQVQVNTRQVELIEAPPCTSLDRAEPFPVAVDNEPFPNQLNGEEFLELNEATSISCSSCMHAAANLCLILLLRIQDTCNSYLRS